MPRLPSYALFGLLALIGAECVLLLRVPLVLDYFYLLVWWPYILLADGLVYSRLGTSLLKRRPFVLATMGPWSVTIWLVFEAYNLILQNWHYVNLVAARPLRWAGYACAFATVLPGIFETSDLLRSWGVARQARTPQFTLSRRGERISMGVGLAFLLLPLLWPRYFFPLVWGGFALLVDPQNGRRGGPSLLKDLSVGRPERILRLLAAGLICGLLWEFWNFWSGAKWVYTVPFVGDVKLFEMPALGFLGFPPFALECYVLYTFLTLRGLALPWEDEARDALTRHARGGEPVRPVGLWILPLMTQVILWVGLFSLIDRYTVWSFH